MLGKVSHAPAAVACDEVDKRYFVEQGHSPLSGSHPDAFPQTRAPAVSQGCDCSIPADAGTVIKRTRSFSIVIIGAHALALIAFGMFSPPQWVASLCAIISAGVLLCCHQKGIYTCAPVFYVLAALFDVLAAIVWMGPAKHASALAVVPLFAAFVAITGAVYGFQACSSWATSAGTVPVTTLVTIQPSAPTAVATVVNHRPQPNGSGAYVGGNA